MKGRALIDLPEHKLVCGQYGSIPNDVGASLVKAGSFDPKATLPGQADDFPKQKGKASDAGNSAAGDSEAGGTGNADDDGSSVSTAGGSSNTSSSAEGGDSPATTEDQAK